MTKSEILKEKDLPTRRYEALEVVNKKLKALIDYLVSHGFDSPMFILHDAGRPDGGDGLRVFRKKINGQMPYPSLESEGDVLCEILAQSVPEQSEFFSYPRDFDKTEREQVEEITIEQMKQIYGISMPATS